MGRIVRVAPARRSTGARTVGPPSAVYCGGGDTLVDEKRPAGRSETEGGGALVPVSVCGVLGTASERAARWTYGVRTDPRQRVPMRRSAIMSCGRGKAAATTHGNA